MQYRALVLGLTAAVVMAAPALANHGKVGLWNVTSSTDVALPVSISASTYMSWISSNSGLRRA